MVLIICVRFHLNISNCIKLQSGHEFMTEMAMFNVQRAIIPKVVHVFCTSSYGALHLCEVP